MHALFLCGGSDELIMQRNMFWLEYGEQNAILKSLPPIVLLHRLLLSDVHVRCLASKHAHRVLQIYAKTEMYIPPRLYYESEMTRDEVRRPRSRDIML